MIVIVAVLLEVEMFAGSNKLEGLSITTLDINISQTSVEMKNT